MISLDFVEKECVKCHKKRRFMKGTPREEQSICGNCWEWELPSA